MYKFAAASEAESFTKCGLCPIVFGAARPGYTDEQVRRWIEFMLDREIQRVCCLLTKKQLDHYPDLLGSYRQAFGKERVCWAPIEDFSLVTPEIMIESYLF